MADNKSVTSNGTNNSNWFGRLINGDFGLAKTYWFYGVFAALVANVFLYVIPSDPLLYWAIFLTYVVYIVVVFGGIWRAADKYQGPAVWAVLAKVAVFMGLLRLMFTFFSKG